MTESASNYPASYRLWEQAIADEDYDLAKTYEKSEISAEVAPHEIIASTIKKRSNSPSWSLNHIDWASEGLL